MFNSPAEIKHAQVTTKTYASGKFNYMVTCTAYLIMRHQLLLCKIIQLYKSDITMVTANTKN